MHAYVGGISNERKCPVLTIGGIEDHVHILARIHSTVAVAEWVKELKRSSSIWAKEIDPNFHWQSGYGAFSIGRSEVEFVRGYIGRQEEHHRHQSFQDELRELLREHGIEWNEDHLWD
jgi:REP element-mobilizing transposase RayT